MIRLSGSLCIASAATNSGLLPGLQTEMKLLTGIDDFFDDLAQLIDLDRKNAAIRRRHNRIR